jgi:hypothetical protein
MLNVSADFEHSDREESDQGSSPRQVAGPAEKLLRSAHRATCAGDRTSPQIARRSAVNAVPDKY